VKELCEGPSLNRSLETLAGLSRRIGSSSYKDRSSVFVGTKSHQNEACDIKTIRLYILLSINMIQQHVLFP
jgi:hypothetical protein